MRKITLLFLVASVFTVSTQVRAADIDWKSTMVIAERQRDAEGKLLPLQSHEEFLPASGRHRKAGATLQDNVAPLSSDITIQVININKIRTVYPQKLVGCSKPILHIL